MSEKYYVCSDSLLQSLRSSAFAEGADEGDHDVGGLSCDDTNRLT